MVRPKTWRAFKLLEQRRQSQGLLSYHRFQYFMSIFCRSKKYRFCCMQFWFWMFTFLCDKSLRNHWKMRFIFFFPSCGLYLFKANMLQLLLCSHWLSARLLSGARSCPSSPSSCGRWWRRELEGRASGVVAVGTSPGTLGPLSPLVWSKFWGLVEIVRFGKNCEFCC